MIKYPITKKPRGGEISALFEKARIKHPNEDLNPTIEIEYEPEIGEWVKNRKVTRDIAFELKIKRIFPLVIFISGSFLLITHIFLQ